MRARAVLFCLCSLTSACKLDWQARDKRDAQSLDGRVDDGDEREDGGPEHEDGGPEHDAGRDASRDSGDAVTCADLPCEHGGTCVDTQGAARCACPATWSGAQCADDVNECADDHGCPSIFACLNVPGGHTCAGELADFPLPAANEARTAAEFARSSTGDTVLDTLTGLRWEANIHDAETDFLGAQRYCESLVLDEHDDYRLPSLLESMTLYHGRSANAYYGDDAPPYPLSDLANLNNLSLWTLSVMGSPPAHVFYWYPMGTWNAFPSEGPRAFTRCVRNEVLKCTVPPQLRFQKHEGLVHDACTGLVWADSPSPTAGGFSAQRAYCASLALGGRTFRVPSLLELMSIFDGGRTEGLAAAFVSVAGCYMSSTLVRSDDPSSDDAHRMVTYDTLDWDSTEYKPECLVRCVADVP